MPDVYREGKFREPDLAALCHRSDPRNQNRFRPGADLTVEIVSLDDPDRDLITKCADYAEAGILEYWIVDPRFETITVLTRSGGACVEHGVFLPGATATSPLLDRFTADVTAMFDSAEGWMAFPDLESVNDPEPSTVMRRARFDFSGFADALIREQVDNGNQRK